jgi:hypothetical protein
MTEPLGVWLYAVTRDLDPRRLAGLTGVAGEPVRTVAAAGLVAVVGSVGLAEFGEQGLRRNLEDLDWLESTARAHDTVVNTVVRLGPTVPLRLATVYLDDERVRASLVDRRADFAAALDRVARRTEWGVKAYADPDALAGPAPAPAEGGGGGAGTAYLLRRRAQLSAREVVERTAVRYAEEIHAALLRAAVDGRRHPAQHPQLTGRREWMLLNGTYLVDDPRANQFAEVVRALDAEHRGVHLELTGPWPPYSFSGVDDAERREPR